MMDGHDWISDEALIGSIQRGDREAAACLYQRHIDRVHRICCRIVLDPSLTLDCGQRSDLVPGVRVTRESPIPFVNETQLLSNTMQGKAGRPIIIGYNRESYGTRVMGAMVVLLEPDTTAPTTEAKTQ